ncbi:MAG: NifB/NifX family molybdenum-iron cluster-binding protein [Lachnospiraceae bacterium]|nr:NifB/NifX family molybdenum-iron cluster-binding protein [Lachnospiraceae bacterium]
MKVAIPLDENKIDVCAAFARAPFFLFWEDGKETVVTNPAAEAQSGAGTQAAQFLVDNAVSVLVTPRCGQNAADVFTAADIKIYKSEKVSAAENISKWQEEKLEKLTHFHAGFHGHA